MDEDQRLTATETLVLIGGGLALFGLGLHASVAIHEETTDLKPQNSTSTPQVQREYTRGRHRN